MVFVPEALRIYCQAKSFAVKKSLVLVTANCALNRSRASPIALDLDGNSRLRMQRQDDSDPSLHRGRRDSSSFKVRMEEWLHERRLSGTISPEPRRGRENRKGISCFPSSGDASRRSCFWMRSRAPPCHAGTPPNPQPPSLALGGRRRPRFCRASQAQSPGRRFAGRKRTSLRSGGNQDLPLDLYGLLMEGAMGVCVQGRNKRTLRPDGKTRRHGVVQKE